MFIKSLTIKGFKSFAEKLKLQFEPGMIAIVGPNGSGKSNIVDAMLWVLGEQSARLLRGNSMEDVIFAGTSVHKALGMAEVSLVLDNSEGKLPVDYAEINIARRLFRSGESEYLLNGRQTKLNEIKELLSEAALGKGLYSIISQGRIDEILSSKPEDRRLFVDEAAGVLKHRLRRDKTERKLKQLDEKILRLNDIYSEILRQIKPLEKQAEDAQRYSGAKDNLTKLETELSARKIVKLKSKWDNLIQGEGKLIGEKEELAKHVESHVHELTGIVAQIQQSRKKHQELSDAREKSLIRNEHFNSLKYRIEQAGEILEQRIEMTVSRLAELQNQDEQFVLFDDKYVADLERELFERKRSAENKESELLAERNAVARLQQNLNEAERLIAKYTVRIQEALLSMRSLNIGATDERIDEVTGQRSETIKEADRIDTELKKQTAMIHHGSGELKQINAQKDAALQLYSNLVKTKTGIDAEISKLTNELTAKRSELQTLNSIYQKKIKNLPQSQAANLAVDHVKLPVEYEDHVLSIFEQEIEGLLIDGRSSIGSLLESGYALTFLDLIGEARQIDEHGLVCLANLSKGRNAAFLSNIYMASSIDQALNCQSKYMGRNIYFIFEDKIFTPYGSVRHVHPKKDSAFLLKKQMLKLDGDIAEITALFEVKNNEAGKLAGDISAAESESEMFQEKSDIQKNLLRDCDVRKQSLEEHLNKAISVRNELDSKLEQLARAKKEAGEKETALHDLINENNDKKTVQEAKLAQIREEAGQKNIKLEVLAEELAGLKLQEASTSKEIEQIKSNFLRSREIADKKKLKIEELQARKSMLENKCRQLKRLVILAARASAFAQKETEAALGLKDQTSKSLESLESVQEKIQKELDELKEKMHEAETQINGYSVSKVEIKIKLADIKSRLEEELEADINEAIANITEGKTSSEIENELRKQRMILAQIGPVNLIAVEELAALREREELYRTQINDLIESKKSLLQVIKELDFLISSTFSDFFEKLSENFQSMVESFFPGGSGKLTLSNIDDVLNCGIDIEVKPSAGKKFQSLTLLSGGERAMSALAFMFSLLLTRPSPFCIMDEVDAALDDFNINKLVKFLVNMKIKSQIILITHQKRTMEAADIIFGISMEPDGTSKALSQKIEVIA